jgi:CRP-like cAMP-binding protein
LTARFAPAAFALAAGPEMAQPRDIKSLARGICRPMGRPPVKPKENFLFFVAPESKTIEVHPGEILCAKGERAISMYIIRSGTMEIFDGPVVYETVGPGDIVGEMAMIDDEPRSASVRAVTETVVIPLDESRFITMVERAPTFGIRVMRVLVRRLRALSDRYQKATS